MSKPLNVLLVESHPWVGEAAAQHLARDGHQVHRCHEQGDTGFACVGLGADHHCPIDGHIDAAVLVRADGSAVPTPHEDGVRCAIRAGVPVVEISGEGPDPFAEWVALQADESSVSSACVTAVELAKQPLIAAVLTKVGPLLHEAGVDADAVDCTIRGEFPDLDLDLRVPTRVDRALEQALGVRAYDALRPLTAAYKTVNVTVHGIP
jgi:hypothetical protein